MNKHSSQQQARLSIVKRTMAHRVEVVILLVLLFVSTLHLIRLLTGAEIVIAGHVVPIWTSLVGSIGPATLAGLFWWSRH